MPAAAPQLRCRHCGAALNALALRAGRGACDAALCRHHEEQQRLQRIRAATAQAALRQIGTDPLVVWLQPNDPALVDVDEARRRAHRAFLDAVVAEGRIIDTHRLAAPTAGDSGPQGAQLCGQCRGHCCRNGAAWQAFLDVTVLQHWQRVNEGTTLEDAVQAYVAWLPPQHVEDSCLYHTEQGCALPREHRADTCNGFACEPLQQVQHSVAEQPLRPILALTFHRGQVQRAAHISAAGLQPLALQAAPDPGR